MKVKMETINFSEFMSGQWRSERWYKDFKMVSVGSGMFLVLAPQVISAQSKESTFNTLFTKVIHGVDWLCVGVFIFSGVSWMFGNRTKAIELAIGGAGGYLIARHSVEIKDFLKSI
jgi:hypothetical protein